MKTVKFFTLGCKANQYDTQSIRERFLSSGFKEISNGQKADYYLINTCTVTSLADQKSRNIIRRCARDNPGSRVIVTGCIAEKNQEALSEIKGVSFIIPKGFFPEGITKFSAHTRAFLKIQDGCDNFCSYCKVPFVRGRSRSRGFSQIIREAEALVAEGFKEIVLAGICLGAFGKDAGGQGSNLDALISELENINGLLRIRLSSIELTDISEDLMKRMSASQKLCHHLHIPLQSGDDEILKKMHRSYSASAYLNLINKLRDKIRDISITTDCLVGFPGETEENFENTLTLINDILPLKVHIFPYSPRDGTAAAKLQPQVAPGTVRSRIGRLKDVARQASVEYRKQFLNKRVSALMEGQVKGACGTWEGYTGNYLRVRVKSSRNLENKLTPLVLRELKPDYSVADMAGPL